MNYITMDYDATVALDDSSKRITIISISVSVYADFISPWRIAALA